jgi:hypothetical protein
VRVRVIAFKDRKALVLREALTTVPRDGRISLLRLPLSFLNIDSVQGTIADTDLPPVAQTKTATLAPRSFGFPLQPTSFDPFGPGIVPACNDPEQTFVDGECAPARIDSAVLPDFEPSLVASPAPGACFDPVACAAGWREAKVEVDAQGNCSAPKDDRSIDNVTLLTQDYGACNDDGRCFIPLDKTDGWREENGRIVLPRGVCRKVLTQKTAELGFAAGTPHGSHHDPAPRRADRRRDGHRDRCLGRGSHRDDRPRRRVADRGTSGGHLHDLGRCERLRRPEL